MDKAIKRNIKLGLFVTGGFIILVWALYSIGRKSNLFSSTITVTSIIHDVNGLQAGNNIRFLGIDIGTVEDVEILNDTSVKVTMRIRDDAVKFIRKNAIAVVGTEGLMGNKIVNILPGTADMPLIEENDMLMSRKAVDTDKMLRTLDITNANVADISKELSDIIKGIKAGHGTIGKLIADSSLALNLQKTIINLRNVSSQAGEITQRLNTISVQLRQEGTVVSALTDTSVKTQINTAIGSFKATGKNAENAAEELEKILQKVKQGEGTVGMLLKDSAVAQDLEKTIENARKSTQTFNENMEALKHSFFFRGYFRKKAKQEQKKN